MVVLMMMMMMTMTFVCAGCIDGYYGARCTAKCNCKNNMVCDSKTGYCPNGCPTSYQPPFCNTSECSEIHISSWLIHKLRQAYVGGGWLI